MFRELSSEETDQVKKWRAPSLADSEGVSNPLAGLHKHSTGDDNATEETITDIAHLRHVVRENQTPPQAAFDESAVDAGTAGNDGHASLEMSNPSGDMLQQSYDEGYSAGVEASKAQSGGAVEATLLSLMSSLAPEKYQMDANIEQEVVSLSKAIAKMLMRREVETDDAMMLEIVSSALEQMPITAQTPIVVLNPADLEIIQAMQTPALATLKMDADMKRGNCRIESGASIMDAGIDALVESIASRPVHATQTPVDSEQDINSDANPDADADADNNTNQAA